MASERTEELYKVLQCKGYPKEFYAEIAYKNRIQIIRIRTLGIFTSPQKRMILLE